MIQSTRFLVAESSLNKTRVRVNKYLVTAFDFGGSFGGEIDRNRADLHTPIDS